MFGRWAVARSRVGDPIRFSLSSQARAWDFGPGLRSLAPGLGFRTLAPGLGFRFSLFRLRASPLGLGLWLWGSGSGSGRRTSARRFGGPSPHASPASAFRWLCRMPVPRPSCRSSFPFLSTPNHHAPLLPASVAPPPLRCARRGLSRLRTWHLALGPGGSFRSRERSLGRGNSGGCFSRNIRAPLPHLFHRRR